MSGILRVGIIAILVWVSSMPAQAWWGDGLLGLLAL